MGERLERTPWEQHATASSLPRFNYKPLSSAHSLKGFLITCAFDREKSATKEVMSILLKYFRSPSLHTATEGSLCLQEKQPLSQETCMVPHQMCMRTFHHLDGKNEEKGNQILEITVREMAGESTTNGLLPKDLHSNQSDKQHRRKEAEIIVREMAGESTTNDLLPKDLHLNQSDKQHQDKEAVSLKRNRANFENSVLDVESGVFLLKMTQKGIISILWENSNLDPVIVLSKVLADLERGSSPYPRWCQRMVPIQGSCVYSRESLSAVVIKLVKEYLQVSLPTEGQPLKYAISFNRRGFEARVVVSKELQDGEELDRKSCIHVVTAAVASVTPHAIVDLGVPQMVVIVEVMPLAGVHGSPICGVAVLSGTLMNTKPKLCVKALVPSSHRAKKQ